MGNAVIGVAARITLVEPEIDGERGFVDHS